MKNSNVATTVTSLVILAIGLVAYVKLTEFRQDNTRMQQALAETRLDRDSWVAAAVEAQKTASNAIAECKRAQINALQMESVMHITAQTYFKAGVTGGTLIQLDGVAYADHDAQALAALKLLEHYGIHLDYMHDTTQDTNHTQ